MTLNWRDARAEAVVTRSKELQAQLRAMADELDRYVQALHAEVERQREHQDEEHPSE